MPKPGESEAAIALKLAQQKKKEKEFSIVDKDVGFHFRDTQTKALTLQKW